MKGGAYSGSRSLKQGSLGDTEAIGLIFKCRNDTMKFTSHIAT